MRAFGQRLGLVAELVDDDEALRQLAAARHVLRRAGAHTNRRATEELGALATRVRTRENPVGTAPVRQPEQRTRRDHD